MTFEDFKSDFIVHRLHDGDYVEAFECGENDLNNFIKTYFLIDNKTGCRFITVDALASAVPFYEKNNFIPLNDEDVNDRTRLLYFDLNDLR